MNSSRSIVCDCSRAYSFPGPLSNHSPITILTHQVSSPSVWRPLVDVVEDVSLAVCDARTSSRDDLIEVDFIDNTMVRKNFMAKYSEAAQFYYLSKMTKDECCVFQVFDSLDLEKGCMFFSIREWGLMDTDGLREFRCAAWGF
jgi:hypothetical protein